MAKPKNKGFTSNKMKRDEAARKAMVKQNRKEAEERERQRTLSRSIAGEETLRAARGHGRDPVAALTAIECGELRHTRLCKTSPLFEMCRVYEKVVDLRGGWDFYCGRPKTPTLKELLLYCHKYTDLFDGPNATNYANGLIAIAAHRDSWIRPLHDWKPGSHNAWRQFNSLLRHLFAKYDVPLFMNTAWTDELNSLNSVTYQRWFIHIGAGNNIRTADKLPIPLTKKMSHWFVQAPADFDIPAAFKWAQIVSMGGDERLVRAIMSTRLRNGSGLTDEFWVSCVRWLIQNPMLDTEHYGPIFDYIHNQKYTPSVPNPSTDWREPRLVPPQPNFTMKGRNPETLLKLVEEWHKKLGRDAKKGGNDLSWSPSGFPEFEHEEGEGDKKKIYTITEILTSKDLKDEGYAMKHCAGSYASSCARGWSSIWSLKRYDMVNVERMVTIEVGNSQRAITQVRGKYNELPSARVINLLARWGMAGGPAMSKWVR